NRNLSIYYPLSYKIESSRVKTIISGNLQRFNTLHNSSDKFQLQFFIPIILNFITNHSTNPLPTSTKREVTILSQHNINFLKSPFPRIMTQSTQSVFQNI